MKTIFLLPFLLICCLTSFGQTVLHVSETQKTTQNGIEITLAKGKPLTGFVVDNYPNGQPKYWITLKDGMPNGLWKEWYENGQLKFSANWLEGKGQGLWEYYHDNGVLRQEEYYNLDIPNGIFRDYYNNGQLKSKSMWLNGKKQGEWTYFNEAGILLKTERYDDNKLIASQQH